MKNLYSVKDQFLGKGVIIPISEGKKTSFKKITLGKEMTDQKIRNAVKEGVSIDYFNQSEEALKRDPLKSYVITYKQKLESSTVKATLDFSKAIKVTKTTAPSNDHFKYQNELIRKLGVEGADVLLAKVADDYTEEDIEFLRELVGNKRLGKDKLFVALHGK